MEPVRIAMLGMGRMGTDLAHICKELPQAQLTAICGHGVEKVSSLAAELKVPGYLECEEMLEKHPETEVVCIATQSTDQVRLAPTLSVIAAGKDIMLEGPLAMSIDAAEQIVEAAEKAGVRILMNETLHFEPRIAGARKAILDGEIGELLHLYLRHNLRKELAEFRKWEFSIVWEIAWHDLAALRWLTGREVKKVVARGIEKDASTGDHAAVVVALLTFDDGTLAVLENAWGTPQVMGPVPNMVLQARGTKGVIDLSPADTGAIVFTPESVRSIDATTRPLVHGGHWAGVYRDQTAWLLHCIRTGAQPPTDGRDGLAEVRIIDAIHRSLETGEEIAL
jgi:predicted dehydrogenase